MPANPRLSWGSSLPAMAIVFGGTAEPRNRLTCEPVLVVSQAKRRSFKAATGPERETRHAEDRRYRGDGKLGLPVVEELVNAGFQVTALVRDPQSAMQRLPADVRIVQADVRDIESLEAGLSGQDAVYLNLSIAPSAREGDFHTRRKVSTTSSPPRVAQGSADRISLGDDRAAQPGPVAGIDIWRKAIARIKASGISYTSLRHELHGDVAAKAHVRAHAFAGGNGAISQPLDLPARDYALHPAYRSGWPGPRTANNLVQGPVPLTYDEATIRFARSFGRRLFVFRIPLSVLKWLGTFSRQANFSANILEAVLAYPEKFKAHRTWKELGMATGGSAWALMRWAIEGSKQHREA